jgi:hypothetical protein
LVGNSFGHVPSGINGNGPLVGPPESNRGVPGFLLRGHLPPAELDRSGPSFLLTGDPLAEALAEALADALALGEAEADALLAAEALVVPSLERASQAMPSPSGSSPLGSEGSCS